MSARQHLLASTARQHVYCDFEYRDEGRQLILGCFWHHETDERVTIDFRRSNPDATGQLSALTARWAGAYWLAYAAHAEIAACLTAGVEVAGMRWIDLAAEGRQITTSYPGLIMPAGKTNLLTTLATFDIPAGGDALHKKRMRDLILATDQYTAEQWEAIKAYGWTDVDPLPALWAAIRGVHAACPKEYSEHAAVFRTDFVVAQARLEQRSRGFPVDVPLVHRIFGNHKLVTAELAAQVNEKYGPVYVYNKTRDAHSFSFKGLADNIDRQPVRPDWEVTASGRLRTDEDYLKRFCQRNPYYAVLYETLTLLRQFRSTDLRPQLRDGFIKGISLPFHTSTGRSQPLVSRGFILNMSPWMRRMVRPHPQHVLIAGDWSQQEIVIAAALSGDQELKRAIETGDVYLALAKMAGAAPADATKQSHPAQRQQFKSCQLGLGYGMHAESLGRKMFADLFELGLQADPEECTARAKDILRWHRRTFHRFWTYSEERVYIAQHDGWLRTFDGWTTFANLNTNPRRLGNFPCQANGAVIMREAIKRLAAHPDVEFVCTLHDAIYIYCHEDQQAKHTAILLRCMREATDAVLRHAAVPMPIRIDTKAYTNAEGVVDPRGITTFNRIMGVLEAKGV